MMSKCQLLHGRKSRGQSEMVGFAVILIMVAVIGMVLLTISDKDEEPEDDFALKSFVQSILGYTTECQDSRGEHLPLRKAMFICEESQLCYSGEDPCDIVNETLLGILENSWRIGEDWPTSGYSLQVLGKDVKIFETIRGNTTNRVRSSNQVFESGIMINFKVYT